MPRLWIAFCCLTLIACDKKTPSPPVVGDPGSTPTTINGTERLGWDQPAADTVELAAIAYAAYVDGVRAELTGVSCAPTAAAAGFACTARLPAMSPGQHALELASFVNDGGVRESARSAALHVTLAAQTAATAPVTAAPRLRRGLAWRRTTGAADVESPIDVAFAPDGRVFVAEPGGRIRVLESAAASAAVGEGIELLAIAIDPQFARTHYVFAIYTAPARSGEMTFTLARFREVSGTFGDRAIVLDAVPASPSPAAALRFGPDGKLYAAFDDGGDPRRRRDPGSLNGKVLRLNADGTTPADARGGMPVEAEGFGSPAAIDWDPATATLWVADRAAGAAPFAFYRGALMPAWTGRLIGADTLFERGAERGVAFIAIAADGTIYCGRDGGLVRLAPGRGA